MYVDGESLDKKFFSEGNDVFREGDPGDAAYLVKTLIQILVENLRNVHEIYMKRPRSVIDFFNAISFHTNGLANNLENNKDVDPSGEGLKRLQLIEDQLQVLHEQFASFKDRRANVLDESGEEIDPG